MGEGANQQITVGVRTDGRVILTAGSMFFVDMNLAAAEWLRDRLFHVCARERAAEQKPVVQGEPAVQREGASDGE